MIFTQKPSINTCLTKEIENFVVNVSCNNNESLLNITDEPVIEFSQSDLLNNESNINCVVTIVVNNNVGMSNQPSSKPFGKQCANCMITSLVYITQSAV